MTRVVVADDQPLARAGLRKILDVDPGITVVAEAEDGLGAVAAVERTRPDVVVMDIRMPGVDGLEATRRVLALDGDVPRVLVLTTFGMDEYVFGALRAGASGFLLKDVPPEDLIRAVHTIAGGEALLAPAITRTVVERFTRIPEASPELKARLEELTDREAQVLLLMARGRSNREIADELIIGEGTVKTHVLRVLRKLGLRDRVQAVIFGYESGLTQVGEAGF